MIMVVQRLKEMDTLAAPLQALALRLHVILVLYALRAPVLVLQWSLAIFVLPRRSNGREPVLFDGLNCV